MSKDKIFADPKNQVAPFEFNAQVAEVFDDMLSRSVPLYRENIRRQAELTERFYQSGTRIYDLGCSNGNFGLVLCEKMAERDFSMVAVDSSKPMLEIYDRRLAEIPQRQRIDLRQGDIRDIEITGASVVVINLTLQFLPLADRDTLIGRIHNALVPGGVLLLTEKVVHEDQALSDLQVEFYYRFKAENGYSQMEISQKREALENVLIPETVENHRQRLESAGFKACDIWLKWFNFASLLAIKGE